MVQLIECYDFLMKGVNLASLADETGPLGLDQTGLAAALGVTQAAVSQWVSGRRAPSPSVTATLERAASEPEAVVLAHTSRGQAVTAPANRWTPAFTPASQFRLPLRIDWSGRDKDRWRDARKDSDRVLAYTLVIDEGGPGDIARWVDPQFVADHWDQMMIARERREPWRRHLAALGYFKGGDGAH